MTDLTLSLGLDTSDWNTKIEGAMTQMNGFVDSLQGLDDAFALPEFKMNVENFIPIIDQNTKIMPITKNINLADIVFKNLKVIGGEVTKIKVDFRKGAWFVGVEKIREDFHSWLKETLESKPMKRIKMGFVNSRFSFDGDDSPKKALTKIFNKVGNIEGIKWKITPKTIDVGNVKIPITGIGSLQETINTMPKSISVKHTSDTDTVKALEGITGSVNDLGTLTMRLVNQLNELVKL